jgi:5'-nucleotidase
VVFSDPLKAVENAAAELTRKDIDIIIVLSHQGFEKDIEVAKTTAGVDVVVGGHTHTLMGDFENLAGLAAEADYPYVVKNAQQETVLVVQAWEKSKALGILKVQFDGAGKVVGYSGHPVILTGHKAEDFIQKNSGGQKEPVDSETFKAIAAVIERNPTLEMIAGDPEALTLLERFSGPIRELKQAVIGRSEADLWNVRQPGDTHETAGRLENGSLIAPVVAEALLWKAKSLKNKNTQMVIQNAGSVRGDIPKGDVTIGQVYELLPFDNTLVLFDLEGSKLKEALKAAIVKADGAFPYAAGLRYSADLSQPRQALLKTVEVQNGKEWVPLEDDETYHIAANNFIASGKDDYTIFGKVKDKDDTGYTAAEVFIEYVKAFKTLKRPGNRVSMTW